MLNSGSPFKIYIKWTALLSAILASLFYVFAPIVPSVMNLMGVKSFLGMEFSGKEEKSYVNVLLMGVDKSETLSDVMMLAQLNVATSSVNILQIPRDTHVNNRRADKKLNSAISAGGPERTIRELQTVVDVDIDEYVLVTTSGFRDVIDAVGGVYYDIPHDMNYDDPLQDLHIHLKKGYQLLDGDKAEQFVRYRAGYATGDLGRIEAQSGFIKEAIRQIVEKYSGSSDSETGELLSTLMGMVDTSFSISDILKYTPYILSVDMNSVNIMRLEGDGRYINGVSYFMPNDRKNKQLIHEYFSPDTTTADLSEVRARDNAKGKNSLEKNTSEALGLNIPKDKLNVYLMDYSDSDGISLSRVTSILEEHGYNIVGSIEAKTCYSDKTYAISKSDSEYSSILASDLGLDTYTINDNLESEADIVVIIGKDM